MDTTTTKPDRNPDHDYHAANIYKAMALRVYCRYVDLRRAAEFRGVDIQGHGLLPTQAAASEAYNEAVEDSIWEDADSIDAVLALVEFAGVIAADNLAGEVLREPAGASERDAFAQLIALANAGQWLNQHAMDAWIKRRKEAFGPSGMRSSDGGEA